MIDAKTYNEADAVSFYPNEVTAVKAALDVLEGLDRALSAGQGVSYVHSAEIILGASGEPFATIWWDSETETWRVNLSRGADGSGG